MSNTKDATFNRQKETSIQHIFLAKHKKKKETFKICLFKLLRYLYNLPIKLFFFSSKTNQAYLISNKYK